MVYMGISLFILRRALRVSGCMRTYAYNLTVPYPQPYLHTMSIRSPTSNAQKEIFILESDWLAARVYFHQPLHCKVGLLIIKVKSFPPLCPQILWAPHLIMDVQQEIINCQFIPSGFHFSLEILIHSSTSSLQQRYTI